MNIAQNNSNNNSNSTEFRIPYCINTSLCLKYLRRVRVFVSVFRCFLCSVFVVCAEAQMGKNKIKALFSVSFLRSVLQSMCCDQPCASRHGYGKLKPSNLSLLLSPVWRSRILRTGCCPSGLLYQVTSFQVKSLCYQLSSSFLLKRSWSLILESHN